MKDEDEKRTPAETERLAKETMRRMLATPPTPYVKPKKKKLKSRQK